MKAPIIGIVVVVGLLTLGVRSTRSMKPNRPSSRSSANWSEPRILTPACT